jgi:hypothetical protein
MSEKITQNTAPKFKNLADEIPPEFLITLGNQKFVKFGGLLYLIGRKGEFRVQTTRLPCAGDGAFYEAKAWLIPSKAYLEEIGVDNDNPCLSLLLEPVITHATSDRSNTSPNMLKFKDCLAETRAIARALRILSGCSYTAVDELDRSDFKKGGAVEDISVQTLEEMVAASKETAATMPALPSSRKESITYLKEAKRDNKGVTEVINSYLDCNNAALLENLSDASLQELYGKVYKLIKG